MTICAAYGCNIESGTHRISMFKFPRDLKRKNLLIQKLNRGRTATTNFVPSSHAKLCVRHFEDSQFLISPKLANDVGFKNFRLRLKPDAVPTIFNSQNRLACRPSAKAISKKKLQHEGIPYEFHSDSKARFWVHYGLVILGFLFAVVTIIAQWSKPAPYGKHGSDDGNWGVLIPQRLGHILSDAIPGILLFVLIFIFYGNQREYSNYIFLSCWLLHYLHRGLIHPLIMRYRNKMVPLGISVGGFIPNCLFHFINADFVGNSNFDNKYYYDPRFILGLILFVTGYVINKWADFKLRSLRQRKEENKSLKETTAENAALKESQGENGYYIPHGGLYELITCPNYFGELVEWLGWSVLTWSLAGLVFMMFSAATFIPRSKHNHNWYREKFELYPKSRKALIPFIY